MEKGITKLLDKDGFRANVAIVLSDGQGHVLWAKRLGQDAWQFPQGGVDINESAEQALYRELYEEIGLQAGDVELMQSSKRWLRYKIPPAMQRKGKTPICVGQKQKWFFLRLTSEANKIRLDATSSPEFDAWQWVHYWHPLAAVVTFKRGVYRAALKEFSGQNRRLELAIHSGGT